MKPEKEETATLAGGCFWCTEAIFKRVKGVRSVVSGYAGGHKENPTYEQVTLGTTGHAEAVQVTFDPDVISYNRILDIFFHTHDPTTVNRQGNDVGTQYRSVIFFHDKAQQKQAQELKLRVEHEGYWKNGIVTEIVPFTAFYKADTHHQDFYDQNREYSYCQYVISPKIQKLLKTYTTLVK